MLTQQQLEPLITQGESETVEFKESLDGEAFQTISAFANTRGGTLLVGVRDNGTVKGINLGKETIRDWANQIGQTVGLNPRINDIKFDGEKVVIIEVSESTFKPVTYRGRAYVRVGKSTRQMNDEELTRAVLEKVGMTWDEVIEPRATLDDLSSEQIRRFRTLCNQKGRRTIPPDDDDATVLKKLGLLKDGKPLRATVLLFGKEPQRFYLMAAVKVGRFRSPTVIVDDREIYGTLFDQVQETLAYFRERLATRFEFSGKPERDVIWEYPLEALREAVTNAVIHRDYVASTHIQVRWYDDRILILNSGPLIPPLSPEKLKQEHHSQVRNRKIAEMFFYAGLIEQWGSGTLKMVDLCHEAGLPEPEFEEKQGGLWLTFRQDVLTEEHLRSLGLNEREIKAVLHTKEQGRITNTQYQRLCHVSKRTATDDLKHLEEMNILERVGTTGRGTYYQLKGQKRGKTGNKGAEKGQNGN